MQHPELKPYDWIRVSNRTCVVMNVYPANSSFGVCKVVFNKTKPTTHDVDWDGQNWFSLSVLILGDMVEMDVHLFES